MFAKAALNNNIQVLMLNIRDEVSKHNLLSQKSLASFVVS